MLNDVPELLEWSRRENYLMLNMCRSIAGCNVSIAANQSWSWEVPTANAESCDLEWTLIVPFHTEDKSQLLLGVTGYFVLCDRGIGEGTGTLTSKVSDTSLLRMCFCWLHMWEFKFFSLETKEQGSDETVWEEELSPEERGRTSQSNTSDMTSFAKVKNRMSTFQQKWRCHTDDQLNPV